MTIGASPERTRSQARALSFSESAEWRTAARDPGSGAGRQPDLGGSGWPPERLEPRERLPTAPAAAELRVPLHRVDAARDVRQDGPARVATLAGDRADPSPLLERSERLATWPRFGRKLRQPDDPPVRERL